jgi:hypothetical protein
MRNENACCNWNSWTLDGNVIHDLTTSTGRIIARLTQMYLDGWELWDWRDGSVNRKRVDTYRSLQQAKLEGERLNQLSSRASGVRLPSQL